MKKKFPLRTKFSEVDVGKTKKTFTRTERHCHVLHEWMIGKPNKIIKSISFVAVSRQIMDKSLLHWTGGNVFFTFPRSLELEI